MMDLIIIVLASLFQPQTSPVGRGRTPSPTIDVFIQVGGGMHQIPMVMKPCYHTTGLHVVHT